MPHSDLLSLGPVLSAEQCRASLSVSAKWIGVGVYLLSNRNTGELIYCGTSKTPSRLKSHLAKDDLARGPVGKTKSNPPLRSYCLAQPRGWLGVQYVVLADEQAARALERAIIAKLGIRSMGGKLFNRSLSG